VLSPICWYESRSLGALAGSPVKAALDLSKWAARRLIPKLPDWRGELLSLSDAILPNSSAEARQLVRLFGADRERVHIVPNGVDPRFAHADPGPFRSLPAGRPNHRDFVLYAGRIEPRKNVLGLIRASRLANLPLVVIGVTVPGHEAYAQLCRQEGGRSTTFFGPLDHADPLLSSAMACARVFALPSWFETPGLAALEAAMAGCAIAITPYGCTREYFGDHVEYAPPRRPRLIAHALQRAWEDGPSATLKAHIAANFAWSSVAIATREAYERVS
jgi:glycosyltransferase involved in cell wall biosynthesis